MERKGKEKEFGYFIFMIFSHFCFVIIITLQKTEALELLEEADDNQNRPCHVAAKEGNKELMDYLMRKGVDLTVPNDKLFTCMVCCGWWMVFFRSEKIPLN